MDRFAPNLPTDLLELLDASWTPEEGGLDAYLARFLAACSERFRASGASIFLSSDAPGVFRLAATGGVETGIPSTARVVDGEGIAGASVQSGVAMLVGDPSSHRLLATKRLGRRLEIGSALVVPLMHGGTCLGVLNMSRAAGQTPFSETDLAHARAVASFLALAVSNARMLAESRSDKRKLQAVLDCLGVAVIVLDLGGQLTNCNAEADRTLGCACEGQRFDKAPEALRNAIDGALKAALAGEASRVRVRDEFSDRAWSVVATPVTGGGATAAIEEVTEAERALAESARLKRLAEIGQLTATIAHEIRNPLTGIRGAAQLVSQSPEEAATLGRVIEQEAVKLNSLCDEFLDFAKPLAIRPHSVDLAALAQRVATTHRAQFAEAGVDLQIEGTSGQVFADELRLEQVMRNLLLNALQACGPGDGVRVTVDPDGFTVDDTGCGMDPETVKRLCTPFFTTKAQGTGLGLSTARKVVEAHGGALLASSKPGEGSRFEVRLPIQYEETRLSA